MKKMLLCSSAGLAIAVLSVPAIAQDKAPDASASADSDNSGVQDIIVTAQRRSESLQKAAIAVSAVSGESLARAGITKPTELTSVVPSLQVAAVAGPYNVFYLRGVGNFTGNALAESAVAFNMDGVYVGRPSGTTGYFYDLERVEVVKGPQGTLYGRNATGGAVNVISRKPELGKRAMSASVDFGNYNAVRFDAAINLPLGDDVAVRLAGIRVVHDGYMDDGTDDQKDWGLRGSLRFEPSSNLKILVSADYFDQGGKGAGATPLLSFTGSASAATINIADRIGFLSPRGQAIFSASPNFTLGRTFYPVPAGLGQFVNNKFWSLTANLEWSTSAGTLTIIPSHREGALDYRSFAAGFLTQQREKSRQDSVEARFATPDSNPLRALLGAYYYREKTVDPIAIYNQQSNQTYEPDLRLGTESKALFGRLTYEVVPDVRLVIGARETWERKTFQGTLITTNRICTAAACPDAPQIPYTLLPPALGAFPAVLVPALGPSPYGGLPDVVNAPDLIQTAAIITPNRKQSASKFTWRAGADWDITPRNLLYASYETGFKAGGFFFSNDRGVYNPETISAFTIGSKNRFFNNKLQLNLELFYWRYRDQQSSHLTQDSTGAVIFATENIGRATYKGFEVEAVATPTSTTTLNAEVQYLGAKYNSFAYTTPNLNGGIDNGTGCPNAAPPTTSYTVNCAGQRPPFAPEWSINLGANQNVPVSFGQFSANVRAHYQSGSMASTDFLPIEFQKAYWLVDAGLTFTDPDKHFSISAYVSNMFDETVKGQVFKNPFGPLYNATLRPPRTYGVRLGFDF